MFLHERSYEHYPLLLFIFVCILANPLLPSKQAYFFNGPFYERIHNATKKKKKKIEWHSPHMSTSSFLFQSFDLFFVFFFRIFGWDTPWKEKITRRFSLTFSFSCLEVLESSSKMCCLWYMVIILETNLF